MTIASPSIAGALGGLALGLVEYLTVLAMVGRALKREGAEGGEMPGLEFVERRFVAFRRGLAAVSFLALPALGYAVGAAFGAGSETSP